MSENQIELAVVNAEGEKVQTVPLDLSVFDDRRRGRLLHDVVVMYQANQRVGTHETKTRGKVAGSTHKPWRQKGTGRARAGTRKSPLWRGGGVIFGPHPRDYSFQVNRKQRRRALRSAIFGKLRDGEVRVIDRISLDAPKTRQIARLLSSLQIQTPCLIGVSSHDKNIVLATRNIPDVSVKSVRDFNALDVLRARTLLLTREALDVLAEGGSSPAQAGPGESASSSEGGGE